MKPTILLFLLCSFLFIFAACKDEQTKEKIIPLKSAEEQLEEKYNAYQYSADEFFGDFASRYRQIKAIIQKDYDFSDFYYFSDDLYHLQKNLSKALALPATHELDSQALNYLNTINALLPLDKKLSDYSNTKGYLKDGGAAAILLCRQLLPLLREAAQAQRAFFEALQKSEDKHLLTTLQKYPNGSPQRYRLNTLYYARRIHQGFIDWSAAYDSQDDAKRREQLKMQLEQDVVAFDKLAQEYFTKMPETGSCVVFMNTLTDLARKSRSILTNLIQEKYSTEISKEPSLKDTPENINTNFIQRNNDLLILKRHYLKVIESYNQSGC